MIRYIRKDVKESTSVSGKSTKYGIAFIYITLFVSSVDKFPS